MLLYKSQKAFALGIIPKEIEQLNNKISPIINTKIEAFQANEDLNLNTNLDKDLAYKDVGFSSLLQ